MANATASISEILEKGSTDELASIYNLFQQLFKSWLLAFKGVFSPVQHIDLVSRRF